MPKMRDGGKYLKNYAVNICTESRKMDQENFRQGVPNTERF